MTLHFEDCVVQRAAQITVAGLRRFLTGKGFMAQLGCVSQRKGKFFANVDTNYLGVRYHFEGAPRDDEQQAKDDLAYIRSAAECGETYMEKIQDMKIAAKELRDAAKVEKSAATWGVVNQDASGRYFVRMFRAVPALARSTFKWKQA